ncbi:MAG: VanZ family protein [Christensenellaceae bacterium]
MKARGGRQGVRRIAGWLFAMLHVAFYGVLLFLSARTGKESAADADLILGFLGNNLSVTFLRKAVGHFGGFAFLAFLCGVAVRLQISKKKAPLAFAVLLLVGVLEGAGTEMVQYFTEGRVASISDVLLDSLGFFVGLLIAFLCLIPLLKGRN